MVKKIAYQIINEDQIKGFEKKSEMNLSIADPDIGRFGVNIFKQKGEVEIVTRNIKTEIPSAASLGLPLILNDLIMRKNGIVLFIGRTGSGKLTSLAVLIGHRNKNSDCYIITIEDPAELITLTRNRSLINAKSAVIKRISMTKKIRLACHWFRLMATTMYSRADPINHYA